MKLFCAGVITITYTTGTDNVMEVSLRVESPTGIILSREQELHTAFSRKHNHREATISYPVLKSADPCKFHNIGYRFSFSFQILIHVFI